VLQFRLLLFFCVIATSFTHAAIKTIERVGDAGQIMLPLAAASMAALFNDKQGAIQFCEVFLATEITAQVLKCSVNSKRPNGKNHSFPSGHTAAAFAGSGFIQKRYGWKYGLPAHVLAVFIGYSRVRANHHWTRDVVAGAAIGLLYNAIFTRHHEALKNLQPVATSKSIALCWNGTF
jgi:membrane-associated phospholipid phosphatase